MVAVSLAHGTASELRLDPLDGDRKRLALMAPLGRSSCQRRVRIVLRTTFSLRPSIAPITDRRVRQLPIRIAVELTKFEPAAFVFAKDAVKPSDKGNGGYSHPCGAAVRRAK